MLNSRIAPATGSGKLIMEFADGIATQVIRKILPAKVVTVMHHHSQTLSSSTIFVYGSPNAMKARIKLLTNAHVGDKVLTSKMFVIRALLKVIVIILQCLLAQ